MKLYISPTNGMRPIVLPLPTAVLGLRPVWQLLAANSVAQGLPPEALRTLLPALRRYVRTHGHFDLLTVQTGEHIIFRIRI